MPTDRGPSARRPAPVPGGRGLVALAVVVAALVFAALVGAGPARAADIALVYGFADAGKYDKSFNELAYTGLRGARERHPGLEVLEVEPSERGDASARRATERAALDADLVILVGFTYEPMVTEVAPHFPDTRFALVDGRVDQPNVQSIVYAEEEGSFLAGALGAMITDTGRMGFVGGFDSPTINNFKAGFAHGGRHVLPGVALESRYIGDTPAAFTDPFAGYLAARALIRNGADVVFAAAGSTGLGSLQAARDFGIYGIGVDANQNYLHPGSVLTSMVKRIDVTVMSVIDQWLAGTWRPGLQVAGLKDRAVDLAIDDFNRALVTEDMRRRLDALRQDIAGGRLVVDTTRPAPALFE